MNTRLLVYTLLYSAVCTPCSAVVITLEASNRGWFEQQGDDNGTGSGNNYITGNCGLGDCDDGEFRSWFQYEIPALSDSVLSARLLVDTEDVKVEQGPSMTLNVTSLPVAFGFADLGTGTFYATRDYSAADQNSTQSISLNAAALADIEASQLGVFGTSQRISAGASFGPALPNQFVYGGSGFSDRTRLEITIIPEPTTLALLGIGLISACRRARH